MVNQSQRAANKAKGPPSQLRRAFYSGFAVILTAPWQRRQPRCEDRKLRFGAGF